MADGENINTLGARLDRIEAKLEQLYDVVENAVSRMEQMAERTISVNPLISSKVLHETIRVIGDFEEEKHYGIRASELAILRKLSQPTIYDHLTKLEEADIIRWQRGSDIGLKPHNAKFYSLTSREESLRQIDVLTTLSDNAAVVAQIILRSEAAEGINKEQIISEYLSMNNLTDVDTRTRKKHKKIANEGIAILLQRMLISQEKKADSIYYCVKE